MKRIKLEEGYEQRLLESEVLNPAFSFLLLTDPHHKFYARKRENFDVAKYRQQEEAEKQKAEEEEQKRAALREKVRIMREKRLQAKEEAKSATEAAEKAAQQKAQLEQAFPALDM